MLFGLLNLTFSSSNFVSHHSIQGMRHHRNVVHWWIFLVRKEDKPRITYCWLLNFYFTSLFFVFLKMSSCLAGLVTFDFLLSIVIENLNWQKKPVQFTLLRSQKFQNHFYCPQEAGLFIRITYFLKFSDKQKLCRTTYFNS